MRPVPEPPGLPAVYAAAPYAREVRALLLAHKERGALALTGALGAALAGAVWAGLGPGRGGAESRAGPVILVPVPSARRAVRRRGHDPVRRMAVVAAGRLRRAGVPARVAGVLRQRRPVVDQAGLDARRRRENLAGALEVRAGGAQLLAGGRIVLVDDLITTGASLAEAARALRAAAGTRWEPDMPVYRGATREGREERQTGPRAQRGKSVHGAPEKGTVNIIGSAVRAAVIAAPRDSFE